MVLESGSRLGPYEILSLIGAGGMGEVYKAKDTRLDRTVAIKVLPSHLAESPERRERFEREARAVSSLNHPHICTLHDIGEQDGTHYLVMEYIEGETLADRLKKGPLPLDQAFRYGIQIADALDKAHRQGVVHRDLKPGNIMLTKPGAKLLDFGLAKLKSSEPGQVGSDLSALPTEQKPLTKEGSILGTFQYMAPEQLEGRDADARTDIFAFGSVLYEMVTGKRAFEGKTQASLIGAIMNTDPPALSSLQPLSPPTLDHVTKTCLTKDPDRRWQSAGDLVRNLEWTGKTEANASAVETGAADRYKKRERLLTGLAAILALLLAWRFLLPASGPDTSVTRVEVGLPPDQELTDFIAISPDGRRLAYTAKDKVGPNMLYLRSLDTFESHLVEGTEGAFDPFFSPDGEWVGFFSRAKLQRVAFDGGEPLEIADAPDPWGGTWGTNDSIIFVPALSSGLARISARGGPVETLTAPDNAEGGYGHAWPQWLPDGRQVLFTIWGAEEGYDEKAAVLSLDTGAWSVVLENVTGARYVESGHLLYNSEGTDWDILEGIPFDLEKLQAQGVPVPILDVGVRVGVARSSFSVSRTGTLAYNPGDGSKLTLAWVDREGRATPLQKEQGEYEGPQISPDGARITFGEEQDLWVLDLERGTRTRLTSEGINSRPLWRPDGERIVFSSNRAGSWNIYSTSVGGTGEPELMVASEHSLIAYSISPQGTLALMEYNPVTGNDIWAVPHDGELQPFWVSPFNEMNPQFSPDGRFLAYVSDESGRYEVYVQDYPGTGNRWSISTEGGTEPLWSSDGKELFYRHGNTYLAVDIKTDSAFKAGIPKPLFEGKFLRPRNDRSTEYDIARDGKRFLMIRRDPGSIPTNIHVVLNWLEELKRFAPVDK